MYIELRLYIKIKIIIIYLPLYVYILYDFKYSNNFKNMYVSRGTVKLTDDSYDIITSSYMSGLSKEDLVKANDAAVGGPYSRAVKTKEGGYREKQILYGLQHVKVLKPGSDCGTNRTINVTLTKKNIKNWMYSFVKQGSNLVEITSDNKDKFIGKTVKMRYFSLCESKNGICEKCAGTLFNRLGITNVGLASDIFGSRLKNTSMKQFHNTTVKFSNLDIEEAFNL